MKTEPSTFALLWISSKRPRCRLSSFNLLTGKHLRLSVRLLLCHSQLRICSMVCIWSPLTRLPFINEPKQTLVKLTHQFLCLMLQARFYRRWSNIASTTKITPLRLAKRRKTKKEQTTFYPGIRTSVKLTKPPCLSSSWYLRCEVLFAHSTAGRKLFGYQVTFGSYLQDSSQYD